MDLQTFIMLTPVRYDTVCIWIDGIRDLTKEINVFSATQILTTWVQFNKTRSALAISKLQKMDILSTLNHASNSKFNFTFYQSL